jgi:putative FmdB family regulatory protein
MPGAMPVYEYRCRDCGTRFEARRAAAEADAAIACPAGHTDVARLLSVFATVGRAAAPAPCGAPEPAAPCGSACACHPG